MHCHGNFLSINSLDIYVGFVPRTNHYYKAVRPPQKIGGQGEQPLHFIRQDLKDGGNKDQKENLSYQCLSMSISG